LGPPGFDGNHLNCSRGGGIPGYDGEGRMQVLEGTTTHFSRQATGLVKGGRGARWSESAAKWDHALGVNVGIKRKMRNGSRTL